MALLSAEKGKKKKLKEDFEKSFRPYDLIERRAVCDDVQTL